MPAFVMIRSIAPAIRNVSGVASPRTMLDTSLPGRLCKLLRPILVGLALAGCARGGTAQAPARTAAAISADDLKQRVHIFADDSMAGRSAGTRGHERALAYIVQELTRLGLKPAGDRNGFFQRVPIPEGSGDTLWSSNVVAVLEGSDPALRGQYVAIGAHSDHIGTAGEGVDHELARAINRAVWEQRGRVAGSAPLSERHRAGVEDSVRSAWRLRRPAPLRIDRIYNGADDDGSGSMALLEMAEYYASQPVRPRRSLLFVWHTGEELNLNGSAWFVAHPTVPLARIVALLNVDMIGRGSAKDIQGGGDDYLSVLGARRMSSELAGFVESVNATQARPFALDYSLDTDGHPENLFCRSDHANYAGAGIPIVFFFTNIHEDYHEVTDEAAYLDYPHFARITSYIAALTQTLGDAPRPPLRDGTKPDPRVPCRQ